MGDELRDLEDAAFVAMKSRRYNESVLIWKMLLDKCNDWENGYGHYHLANCYSDLNQNDEAEHHYAEAVKVEPNDKLLSDSLKSFREARAKGFIT